MLGSWFAKQQGDNEQGRRSTELTRIGSGSLAEPNPKVSSAARPSFATPHDAVLSQLQPKPKAEGNPESAYLQSLSPESNASQSKLGMSPVPSTYTGITANLRYAGNQSSVQVQPQTVDHLVDPYDGSSHGVLLPQDINLVHQDHPDDSPLRLVTDSSRSSGEAMWSHLSKVLDLQGQIAKMHIEMEGIGLAEGKRGNITMGMGRSGNSIDERRAFHSQSRLRTRAMSSASTMESGDDKGLGGDEEGVGVADEETERNKAREEEFAKLADQFEGKKESIREIMNKLNDLSRALTEFHALQAPNIEVPSSRRSSMGVTSISPHPVDAPSPSSFPQTTEDKVPLSHASLPPFPTLWSPPKTPFSTTSPQLLPQSFSRVAPRQPKSQKPGLPTVLVDSKEVGNQGHMFESPASVEHLHLPPE